MKTVNIHEAKTHLSRLIAAAMKGEPFVIAKSGKPLVKVEALPAADAPVSRLGFLSGHVLVPSDFDSMAGAEIEATFQGEA